MQAAAFLPGKGRAHDQFSDVNEISQLDEVVADSEVTVVLVYFLFQKIDPSQRSLQALVGSDDSHVVPHETAQFFPVMGNDDVFVRIGDLAFVPVGCAEFRGRLVEPLQDVSGGRAAEYQTLQQRVAREPICAVQARATHLADRV